MSTDETCSIAESSTEALGQAGQAKSQSPSLEMHVFKSYLVAIPTDLSLKFLMAWPHHAGLNCVQKDMYLLGWDLLLPIGCVNMR